MKKIIVTIFILFYGTVMFAQSTITFDRADGVIPSGEYVAEGVSTISNAYVDNNRLEQSNTDVPGAITFTFSVNQTYIQIEFYRHPTYLNNAPELQPGFATLTAYNGINATGNVVATNSLSSSGTLQVSGSNNIKSIQLTGVYDGFGGFNEFDNLYFDVNSPPLPVELSLFTANLINDQIELTWRTQTELNNYGFEVERLLSPHDVKNLVNQDLDEKWELIGFVNGHGNSNSPKNYSFTDNEAEKSGDVSYRLKQIDIDGKFSYSNEVSIKVNNLISNFNLEQNYPNPFNPTTKIKYSIPNLEKNTAIPIKLVIYDILGNELKELLNENKSAGNYIVDFDGTEFASGLYIYQLTYGKQVLSKKMLLLK